MKEEQNIVKEESVASETEKVGISAPWVQYVKAINALFSQDPEIKMEYNEEENIFKLYVDNDIKADAIRKLIPNEKSFGNVTLKIGVIPSNKEESKQSLFRNAFANNPFVSYIKTVEVGTNPMTFVVFKRLILQYFNDNLGDINGNRTTLCEELARELFEEHEGVYFCTDVAEPNNNG